MARRPDRPKSPSRGPSASSRSGAASKPTIVIDGYNLILRSPAFRPDDRRDLAASRDKLVNLLSWVVGSGEVEFVVVFDGNEAALGPRRDRRGSRVSVRFSKPPAKADDLIRELVEELHEARVETTVVTADLEVARHAQACDAKVVLSDLFAASLFPERLREQVARYRKLGKGGKTVAERAGKAASSRRAEEASGEKPLGFSKKELEEWAKLFAAERHEES